MDQRKKSDGVGVMIALVLCVLLLAVYAVGYFALAESDTMAVGTQRLYPHPVVAWVYRPAGWFESSLTRQPVNVGVQRRGFERFLEP